MRFNVLAAAPVLEFSTEETVIQEVIQKPSVIQEYLKNAMPSIVSFGIQLLAAILILFIGSKIAKMLVKMLKHSMERGNADPGVVSFVCSLVKYLLYFLVVMIVLSSFGVTTGSVVAVLGSAGLTVGLALQGSLANFAGGVLIMILKPFKVGDYIIESAGGKEGTVVSITIFYTKLNTVDNKQVLIPNGTLSNTTIVNVSAMDTRKLDLCIGVSYEADLAKTKEVLLEVVKKQEFILQEEPIDIFVADLADSSVDMGVRAWVRNENYWPAKWKLTEDIKNALYENEINIPYPQMDVHMN